MVLHDGIPSDELKNLCDQNGIDLMAVDYVELGVDKSRRNKYLSDVLLEQLVARGVDYCFCFGSCILVGDLLRVFRNRIINFHPSLLPAFPGIKAVDQAIEYGARFLGNTAHFIDEGVDTGPIIMQSIISAEAFSGYDSVLDQQLLMLAQIIKWLEQGRIEVSGRKVNVRDAVCDDLTFMPNVEPDLLQKLL